MHWNSTYNRRLLIGALVAAAIAGTTLWFWPRTSGQPVDPFPLTPISASLHLNTGSDALYVGSESCKKCHEDRHTSFRCTGMDRSMSDIDLAQEPADATFEHHLLACVSNWQLAIFCLTPKRLWIGPTYSHTIAVNPCR
jgi:hypothetical protein